MTEYREIAARNGARVCLRDVSVGDAAQMVALDRAIVGAGEGVVIALEQLRDVEAERGRIDELYRGFSAGSASTWLVAEALEPERRVVGSVELTQLRPAGCRHVGVVGLGIHPDWQRQGLGRALMELMLEHARASGIRRVELYVLSDNERAQALYKSLGFEHEATRRAFVRWEDGTTLDDLIFVKFLD